MLLSRLRLCLSPRTRLLAVFLRTRLPSLHPPKALFISAVFWGGPFGFRRRCMDIRVGRNISPQIPLLIRLHFWFCCAAVAIAILLALRLQVCLELCGQRVWRCPCSNELSAIFDLPAMRSSKTIPSTSLLSDGIGEPPDVSCDSESLSSLRGLVVVVVVRWLWRSIGG